MKRLLVLALAAALMPTAAFANAAPHRTPAPVAAAAATKRPSIFARFRKATPAPMTAFHHSTKTKTAMGGTGMSGAKTPTGVSCAASDPVVWLNTKSKAYHYSSSSFYGKTAHGKYLCESAAKTGGGHATQGEKP